MRAIYPSGGAPGSNKIVVNPASGGDRRVAPVRWIRECPSSPYYSRHNPTARPNALKRRNLAMTYVLVSPKLAEKKRRAFARSRWLDFGSTRALETISTPAIDAISSPAVCRRSSGVSPDT